MRHLKFLLLVWLFSVATGTAALAAIPVGKADALKARAASKGELRLIVQLAAMDQPIGQLLPAARQSRIAQIAAMQTTLLAQARQSGLRELKRFSTIPFLLLKADAQAIETLARLPQVISIQEDLPEAPSLASSLPVIGAANAWADGYDGTGQVVVVLDTGVDTSHPFFPPPKTKAEACFSTSDESDKSMSLCPGGDSSSTVPGSGQNCPAIVTGCHHGTHVAGIAVGNNGAGPNLGVAKGAGIIPIQVFSCFSNNTNCVGNPRALSYQSDQILALEHVLTLSENFDIAAVNMSLGGLVYDDQEECDAENAARKKAIDNLRSVGIATIIAAGNNRNRSGLAQPGCISTAISVGNTTDADLVAESSNVASFIDLLAPGSNITSSYPGGGLFTDTGTSMSTPHVSGAWAVLRQARPESTIDQIYEALRLTGTVVNDQRPQDNPHPAGSVTDMRRINLDLALSLMNTPPEISSTPSAGSAIDFGGVDVGASSTPVNITVSNSGGADLNISCAVQGTHVSSFQVVQCPDSISTLQSVEVQVQCRPLSPGSRLAELRINSDDEDEAEILFNLTCQSHLPPGAIFIDSFEFE